jgi:homoserine/homoserine lactone efflux protein
MTPQLLLLFTATTALACFTPGPAAMYAASVGTLRRRSLVLLALAGIALANALYFGLSALGIAGMIASSPGLYTAIRWAGAAYLVWLGLRMLFGAARSGLVPTARPTEVSGVGVFTKGFLIEIANPKALLYFSALLPQFIAPDRPLAPQFLLFCLITVVLDFCAYSFYGALGFGAARLSSGALLAGVRRLAGAAFLLAGIRLSQA